MTADQHNNATPQPLGRHLLVDLYGVSPASLADGELLERVLIEALGEGGFNVLDCMTHKFPGAEAGVTALALLCESHAAIHTYPEYEYLALDVFSCGAADPELVLEAFRRRLRPTRVARRCEPRGPRFAVPPDHAGSPATSLPH
jgi:S-adenosylmethionine decarboxylase